MTLTLEQATQKVRNAVSADVALDTCLRSRGPEYQAVLEHAVKCDGELESHLPAILSAMEQAKLKVDGFDSFMTVLGEMAPHRNAESPHIEALLDKVKQVATLTARLASAEKVMEAANLLVEAAHDMSREAKNTDGEDDQYGRLNRACAKYYSALAEHRKENETKQPPRVYDCDLDRG